MLHVQPPLCNYVIAHAVRDFDHKLSRHYIRCNIRRYSDTVNWKNIFLLMNTSLAITLNLNYAGYIRFANWAIFRSFANL